MNKINRIVHNNIVTNKMKESDNMKLLLAMLVCGALLGCSNGVDSYGDSTLDTNATVDKKLPLLLDFMDGLCDKRCQRDYKEKFGVDIMDDTYYYIDEILEYGEEHPNEW